ncbi:cellulose synthase subunit BcsC [Aquisphaera giovannonii]|uniref:Cellulose synthase subunit BcsC n=1 Tax=Aquisphaera giovannonii TaxID=406548 RepID=A0A5B9W4V1_9BACT|nr:tetratricopeptide repeat protein [Aquisphaera giovannonii]QEH35287.1 cellulose synthase subunit BcsC [Aquisphaera giovannonii]
MSRQPSPPPPLPARGSPGPARGRLAASLALLAGLLAFTAWVATRSQALEAARGAYVRGDLVDALRLALDHLDRRPWSREAARLAALSLSRLDFAEAAEPYYRRIGELDLEDRQTRAYGLVRGNRRADAIEAYEQILERWPNNVTALRRLAAVQISVNNTPQLLALADRLVKVPGGEAMGQTLRGAVAHMEGDREIAVAAFDRVLAIDPDLKQMPLPHGAFWRYFAEDLLKSGRPEDAQRHLKRALAEESDAVLMTILGRAYFQEGRLDEAESCFKQAAEWDPTDVTSLYELGKVEITRKRFDAAREHLEVARRRAPGRMDVLHELAAAHRLLGHRDESERLEGEIRELRDRSTSARKGKEPWPRYAL